MADAGVGAMNRTSDEYQRVLIAFRKAVEEYVAAVNYTTKPLHNRRDCMPTKPCALCRRRTKAENELLSLVGREPAPAVVSELAALLAAADPLKPKQKM
jgi:hypothetical protein